MSSVKVSALSAKTSPSGSEELLINDGGTSKKITIANLTKGHDLPTVPSGITTDTNKEYNLKLTDVSGTETLTWIEETDTDTTYSTATATTEGLVKIEDDTAQTIAANTVTATASRTYGVQLNSSDQAVVNVPWTDTDTGITDVVDDTTPQLGGNLDFQTHKATSFTSTGIDDNATSTAITIDASENVGIGTASPLGLLHISGSTTTTLPSIVIERTGSGSSKWDIKPYADTLTFRADATTDRLTLTNDGRGLSQFTAKAWVNFNGTGTVAIRDSHNVSSITDMNTGSYLVNFANNMANTLYCPLASSSQGASASTNYNNHVCVQNITTNSRYQLLMRPQATSDTMVDIAYIYSVVFGD